MKHIPANKYLPYWKKLRKINSTYYTQIHELEEEMRNDLQHKGLIFFFVDGEVVGIGSEDRKMKLIHDRDLDRLLK